MFERKSLFRIKNDYNINLEELELDLIDHGLEEIDSYNNELIIYGNFKNFGALNKAIINKNLDVKKIQLKRIPKSPIEFSEEKLKEIENMIDKIEEDDDVQAVFTNII